MSVRKLCVAATVAVSGIVASASAANAIGDLTITWTGLTVHGGDGTQLGNIWRANLTDKQLILGRRVADSYGDRLGIVGYLRDDLANGDAVYAQAWKYNDGAYCYLSGISSNGSGGVSTSVDCSGGWHNDGEWDGGCIPTALGDTGQELFTESRSYVKFNYNYCRDGSEGSQRLRVKVCEDEPSVMPDICGGARVLGIDYN